MVGFINGKISADYTAYSTMTGGTTNPGQLHAVSPGTDLQVLTSTGSSSPPTFQTLAGSGGMSGWTTFTPTIVGTSTAGVGTYTFRAASYALLGYTCYIKGALVWTAHTGTGNPAIGGLPFQQYNTSAYDFRVMRVQSVGWSSGNPMNGNFRVSTADVLHLFNETGSASPFDTAATLWFSGYYEIDR